MSSRLVELAAALVAIDSVNPALVPGGAGEREIASFAASWCDAHGFEVEVLGDERPSVVATKRGSGPGTSPPWASRGGRRRSRHAATATDCTVAERMT